MKTLRRLIRRLLLLLLLLLAGVFFLLATETGVKTSLTLANKFLPSQLSYSQLQGHLFGSLKLTDVVYQDDAQQLQIELQRLTLTWRPRLLLNKRLKINELSVVGLNAKLPPSTDTTEPDQQPLTLPEIKLPLAIELDKVELTAIQIQPSPDADVIVVDQLQLQAVAESDTVQINKLAVSAPQGQASMAGEVQTIADYPLKLNLDWQSNLAEFNTLQGQLALNGELGKQIKISKNINDGADIKLDISGSLAELLTAPNWDIDLQIDAADLGAIRADLKEIGINSELHSQGSLDGFQLRGTVNAKLPQLDMLDVELTADGNLQQYQAQLIADIDGPQLIPLTITSQIEGDTKKINLNQLNARAKQSDLSFSAQAQAQIDTLNFNATGDWQALGWPLEGAAQFASPTGQFKASGTPDAYQFTLNTEVAGDTIPDGSWQVDGQGSAQGLDELNIRGETLAGTLNIDGKAAWQPKVNWQLQINGKSLNPAEQWPDLPGQINFALATTGQLPQTLPAPADDEQYMDEILPESPDIQAQVHLSELSGTFNKQQLAGQGLFQLIGKLVQISQLELAAGAAQLKAQGQVGDQLNLDWQLQVPSLTGLVPDASGAISSKGKLAGTLTAPQAVIDFAVTNLNHTAAQIAQLKGAINVDLQSTSTIKINGNDLAVAGQSWQAINLQGEGTMTEHTLQADVNGALGTFALALAGGLDQQQQLWQGELTTLKALKTQAGDWQLQQPAPLQLAQNKASVDNACLASQPSKVCLQGNWSAEEGGRGNVELTALDLSRFAAFLPQELGINTQLNGQANGSQSADGQLQGELDLTLSPGQLTFTAPEQIVTVDLRQSTIRGNISQNNAQATLNVDLAQLGAVKGDISVKGIDSERAVQGTIKANIDDLNIATAFAPQVQDIAGKINADINISGALPVPNIVGEVRLSDAAVAIPETGTRIEDIQLKASSDGKGPLIFTGSALSGDGQLKLNGQYDLAQEQLDLSVEGKNFQAMNTLDIKALISPQIKLTMTPQAVNINGEITIPQALISPPEISSGVANSRDVVIVENSTDSDNDDNGNEPQQSGAAVNAKLRIKLGDDVKVKVAGFDGQLAGDLTIEQTAQLAPRGTGSVEVVAGDYEIYGQALAIERGRILYSSGPIDNPGLDLKAARVYDDVTVGAQVNGTLREPKLTLFSTPVMPDSSILSYLVFGKPASSNSTDENALLYQAASALGASGGGALTKGITDSIGLDTLEFDSGNTLDEASVELGKYLSPDLYVSYGIGLFEAVNTFKMRYQINDRLSLESSVGTHSSADLLYSVER